MRELLGTAPQTKSVEFLGKKNAVKIIKWSGAEVKAFQEYLKTGMKELPEETQGLALQAYVIRKGVEGASDLTDEELDSFPFEELGNLAKAVLVYAGINTDSAGN